MALLDRESNGYRCVMQSLWSPVRRIVSGGQTGVDRAALDVAIELQLEHGGWCPRGRIAEDGPISDHYQLQETESSDYAVRTERNVIDSDGTLVIYQQRLQRGSLLTYRLAKEHGKPVWRARVDQPIDIAAIQEWLVDHRIAVLNVAGPRQSSHPEIGLAAGKLLRQVLLQRVASQLFE